MLSRRGVLALILAATAAAGTTGCGRAGSSSGGTTPIATSSAALTESVPATGSTTSTVKTSTVEKAKPSVDGKVIPLRRAVGQRLVSGYRGARPTPSILSAVRNGRLGGVILFTENVPTVADARATVRTLRRAAAAGHQAPLLIMIDQEGGDVRRLATLPPTISPAQMGAAAGPEAEARAQGRRTGTALRKLGINVDLAPVADVPDSSGSFLGTRAFSRRPRVVARGACGFAAGLAATGVAGSLKHFPGLGRARGNTDLKPVPVAASRSALMTDLAAYRRCGKTAQMVMIASASYPALGIDRPAVLSPRTYRLLKTFGFKGITITDAFDTPAIAGQQRPALTAMKAGVDILLYGQNEAGAQAAYSRLLNDARSGGISRTAMRKSAARILAFKRSLKASRPR